MIENLHDGMLDIPIDFGTALGSNQPPDCRRASCKFAIAVRWPIGWEASRSRLLAPGSSGRVVYLVHD